MSENNEQLRDESAEKKTGTPSRGKGRLTKRDIEELKEKKRKHRGREMLSREEMQELSNIRALAMRKPEDFANELSALLKKHGVVIHTDDSGAIFAGSCHKPWSLRYGMDIADYSEPELVYDYGKAILQKKFLPIA